MICKLKIAIALTVVAMLALVPACSSDGCYDNTSAIPIVAFYRDGAAVKLTPLSVTGVGVPGDTLLIDSASTSSFHMPLNFNSKQVKWKLYYHDEDLTPDTITIDYDVVMNFVSRDCGAMYFFKITKCGYTNHVIDSIKVLDSLITNIDRTYLQVHIKHLESEEE